MLSYILIAAIILAGFIPIIHEIRTRSFDFFNAKNSFIAYYVIQLALSGFATIYLDQPSSIGLDPTENRGAYDYALAISAAGLVMFQLGYYRRPKRAIKLPALLRADWHAKHTQRLVSAYLAIGLLSFFILLQLNGGLSAFLASREEFRSGGLTGLGLLIFPATGMMAIAVLALLLNTPRQTAPRKWLPRFLLALTLALLPAFFLGFRHAIALPVVQLLVAWHYGHARVSSKKIFATALIFISMFTVYGISREIPAGIDFNFSEFASVATDKPELIYAVVSRSRGTEVVAAVTEKLRQTQDYEYGWPSLLETATIIVPKAIWPDKPQPISERFGNYFFGDTLTLARGYERDNWGGISPTVVGEWYWHFGLVGVLIGLFILGRIASAGYFTLRKYSDSKSVVLIYSIFFTSFSMFAESQQNFSNGLVLYAAVIYVTLRLIRRKAAGQRQTTLR